MGVIIHNYMLPEDTNSYCMYKVFALTVSSRSILFFSRQCWTNIQLCCSSFTLSGVLLISCFSCKLNPQLLASQGNLISIAMKTNCILVMAACVFLIGSVNGQLNVTTTRPRRVCKHPLKFYYKPSDLSIKYSICFQLT